MTREVCVKNSCGNPWAPVGTIPNPNPNPYPNPYPWVPMGKDMGPMGAHGCPWALSHGVPWGPTGKIPWGPMGSHGNNMGALGTHGKGHGYPWEPTGAHGSRTQKCNSLHLSLAWWRFFRIVCCKRTIVHRVALLRRTKNKIQPSRMGCW